MGPSLKALLVGESDADVDLVVWELRNGGYDLVHARVNNPRALAEELRRQTWDVVFCVNPPPDFDPTTVLAALRDSGLDLPVLVVADSIDSESAVTLLKAGAKDCLSKFNLERLLPSVKRELEEANKRRAGVPADPERDRLLERERTARAEAEEAVRFMNQMLSAVSHGLRTHMATMLGWMSMVRDGTAEPSHGLDIIERNMKRQAKAVESLLDITNIVSGKPQAPPRRAEAPHPAGAHRDHARILEGLRLLIVDDDADMREMLQLALKRTGAQVHLASSAEEALQALVALRPHVLVADLAMPGEDGYALIRKVRALGPEQGGAVPAMALTAHAGEEDRERALKAGYGVYLAKPIDISALAEAIAGIAQKE